MANYPLAIEYSHRPGEPRISLTNLYAEPTPQGPREFRLRPRPGLVRPSGALSTAVGSGPVHLLKEFSPNVFTLSGTEVYYNENKIGDVAAGGFTQIAFSDDQVVLVSGWKAYTLTTLSVTEITDPDLPDVSGVVFIAGLFVFSVRDSGEFMWSEPFDAANIGALSFGRASASPDQIARMEVLNDEIVFVGHESIEYQYATGDATTPFRRSIGRSQPKGTRSPYSVIQLDNGIFFSGYDRNAGRAIYRTDGGVPIKISTPSIDALLETVTAFPATGVKAFALVIEGHSFYVITIPDQGTFAYDIATGKWAEWATYNETTFRVLAGDGTHYGDAEGNLFNFDPTAYSDDGGTVQYVASCFVPADGTQRHVRVQVECATGVSLASGQGSNAVAELRSTDDLSGNYTAWEPAGLGLIGDYAARVDWWQQGYATSPGRLYEIRSTDPVLFTATVLRINPTR